MDSTGDVDVIGDLVGRERRSDDLALRTDSRAGSYSYAKLCTNAWKAGNLLRHYGVRGGASVAIDAGDAGDTPSPQPLTALFGAALLGATVRFDPPADTGARVLVAPVDRLARYEPAPGTQVLGYGGDPEAPEAVHYEAQLWSENPNAPPDVVAPDDTALATADASGSLTSFTHERLLTAAERVVEKAGLTGESVVALRAPLALPGTLVAGVLAPVRVGGTVLLDPAGTGSVAVATAEDVPESHRVDPRDVL